MCMLVNISKNAKKGFPYAPMYDIISVHVRLRYEVYHTTSAARNGLLPVSFISEYKQICRGILFGQAISYDYL